MQTLAVGDPLPYQPQSEGFYLRIVGDSFAVVGFLSNIAPAEVSRVQNGGIAYTIAVYEMTKFGSLYSPSPDGEEMRSIMHPAGTVDIPFLSFEIDGTRCHDTVGFNLAQETGTRQQAFLDNDTGNGVFLLCDFPSAILRAQRSLGLESEMMKLIKDVCRKQINVADGEQVDFSIKDAFARNLFDIWDSEGGDLEGGEG